MLQSQPLRSTDTNRTWGRMAGSGPADLLNPGALGGAAPMARGTWGSHSSQGFLSVSMDTQLYTANRSSSSQTLALVGGHWVTGVMGTKSYTIPSPCPPGCPLGQDLGRLGGDPEAGPMEGGTSMSHPQLNSRGIVGQEEGAGACGGLWHQVQCVQAWEKGGRVRPWHHTGTPAWTGCTHFVFSGKTVI